MLRHQFIQKKSNYQCQKDRKGKFYSCVIILLYLFLSGTLLQVLPTLAASPTPGTVIDNQVTGSFTDSTDNTEKQVESNIVKVTVAEVAGITITPANTPGATTGTTVNFDFTVTNVGNDPTQFFIPDAPSAISGGTAGTLQIVAYDPDGSGPGAAVDLTANNITVPNGGQNTGTLLSAIASANNGSIPVGGSIVVRVPVTVTAAGGQTVSVTLGNTSGQPSNSNTPYILGANGTGSKDLYTVDNADNISGESAGAPINGDATNHRQEASAIQTATALNTVSGTIYRDSDRNSTNNGEPGIANVRVILYKDTDNNRELATSEIIQQVTTLADGTYQFTNVAAGTYKIKVDIADTDVPVGYTLGTPDNLTVTVSTTNITGQDFGFYPVSSCEWDAQIYSGHFPISGTQAIDTGAVGLFGTTGLPTLRGTAKFGAGSSGFTFNDQSIAANAHPLRTIINGTFPSSGYVPINGDYTSPGNGSDQPNWAIVFKRQALAKGRVTLGQAGAYIDDSMEIYLNGVRVGNPVLAFTNNLPANKVSTVSVNAGDIIEIRLSNYDNIGGFVVSTDFVSDFGDAPSSYGEASHAISCGNPSLGATVTGEYSQSYSANADGDSGDDGVTLPSGLIIGKSASITVNASTAGFLNAWIDFNKNGVFDSGEQLSLTNVTNATSATVNNVPLNAGNNTLTFTVPSNATVGSSFARFRFTTSTVATPSPTGSGGAGEVEDYAVKLTGQPKLVLVKRITRINNQDLTNIVDGRSDVSTDATNYVASPNDVDDDSSNPWPSGYLRGLINGGTVKPGDELEYTIYFLSNGQGDVTSVQICDLIPTNTTFIPTAFNGMTPNDGGLPGADQGIALGLGSSTPTAYLTNAQDGDRGHFYTANESGIPSSCGSNTNGAVVVNITRSPDLSNLPPANGSGTPINSYGFVRFRVKVK
ncbi:MAG: beta strand repeat-containing protein [Nostoc sp. CmiVER01]|uniref:beta strand repeat-containing protein n=1 Tax=Nostoc sp. CmiVER01 TaxID=3075384 RepID=UPI002AD22AB7|nr:GEVED domain-containing protein [Nostoc sp. CmiVER01]MDZ8125641.1 GEVED domain-containing protein [Nostoc sp. CmiVER01]